MADKYPLSYYRERLHDKRMEHEAREIAQAVLDVLREGGDNLNILAAIRRALIELGSHEPASTL
jgi:plasmid stability protein